MPVGWYVIQPPTDGSSEIALKKVVAALSGQQPEFGPMAATLKPYSFASFGHVPTSGPVQATMKKVLANFSKEYNTGTSAVTLKKAVMASLGQIPFLGNIAATSRVPIASLAGNQNLLGQIASPMKKLENAQFLGTQAQLGGMAAVAKKVSAAMAGDHSAAAGGIAAFIKKLECGWVGTGPVEVQISSTGSSGIIDAVGNTRVVNYGHVSVAGSGQRMYVGAACGHNTWVNPSMTISATVDGNAVTGFTQVSRVDYGNDSGNRLGHIVVWELVAPVAGTYSITVTASASQGIHRLVSNSRVYDNTSGYSGLVTQAQTSTSAAMSLSLTPDAGDMVFLCSAFNDSGLSAVYSPTATPWYSGAGVGARTGDLDTWDFRNILGTGATVNYTSDTSQRMGAIGFIIERA